MISVAGIASVVRLAVAAVVDCATFVPAAGTLIDGVAVVLVVTIPGGT